MVPCDRLCTAFPLASNIVLLLLTVLHVIARSVLRALPYRAPMLFIIDWDLLPAFGVGSWNVIPSWILLSAKAFL